MIQLEQIWRGGGWTATINKLVANYHVIVRDTVTHEQTCHAVQAVDDFIGLIFSFFFPSPAHLDEK